jgi:hypothetical protein
MQNTEETKKRIVNLLQGRGPCLPVQISKEIKQSTLFISAFLSELKDEKRIKISNLKVGGSPLYYLEGQETHLENFKQYLHQKEVEALEILKNNKILKDSEQEPVMRVALRSIKDFAFSFRKDEEIYWRYLTTTEQEVKEILEPQKKVEEIKIEIKEEPKIEPIEVKVEKVGPNLESTEVKVPESINVETSESKVNETKVQKSKPPRKPKETAPKITLTEFNNPLALKSEPEKEEKIKPKSEFVEKVIEFLEKSRFKIIEEKEYAKKEYNCICQLKTELGPIDFLTQAKDKKSISDSDLDLLLRQAQSIPLPALFLYPENLNKKAIEYEKKYYSILKTKKISF